MAILGPDTDPSPTSWFSKVGGAFVFDMRNPVQGGNPCDQIGQWYDWYLPGLGPVGAAVFHGDAYYLDRDAVPRREVDGQFWDDEVDSETDLQIRTEITHAPWAFGGLGTQQIVHRGHLYGVNLGESTYQLSGEIGITDFANPESWTSQDIVLETDGPGEFDFRPIPTRRGNSIEVTLGEKTSASLTEGLGYKGISLEIGLNGKLGHLNAGNRI